MTLVISFYSNSIADKIGLVCLFQNWVQPINLKEGQAKKRLVNCWASWLWLWSLLQITRKKKGWDSWSEFCANCRAILDSHRDQNETIYVSKHQYLSLTLLLNAYSDFCVVAHSEFKVRWIYLSNTCWRKINFYDKWCKPCLGAVWAALSEHSIPTPKRPPLSLWALQRACYLGKFGTELQCTGKETISEYLIILIIPATVWMCPPPKFMLKSYPPKMMVLGDWAFGRCLSPERGALVTGLSVF